MTLHTYSGIIMLRETIVENDMINTDVSFKIGFACKFAHPNKTLTTKQRSEYESRYNTKTTTRAWLNRQSVSVAEAKLWEIIRHNVWATKNLIKYVGELPIALRFLRISSDLLPLYSEQHWSYFYNKPDVKKWLEQSFADLGNTTRSLHIRVSYHPGQFCCLASDSTDVVNNSIQEFEYHADMIRWMGYGQSWQDFKCNIHIGGRLGPDGIRQVLPRLSTEARNTITIENDEFGWGIDSCLELSDIVPIVLDIHHHYIRTGGEYIQPTDPRIEQILNSWRGIRPVMHYSVSREEYIKDNNTLPDMKFLLSEGHKPQSLRAHSDMLNNIACNNWALSFLDKFDIMCESKCKNLSSKQLYEQYILNTDVN